MATAAIAFAVVAFHSWPDSGLNSSQMTSLACFFADDREENFHPTKHSHITAILSSKLEYKNG